METCLAEIFQVPHCITSESGELSFVFGFNFCNPSFMEGVFD